MARRLIRALLAAWLAGGTGAAPAAPYLVAGLEFSDEEGGLVIRNAYGAGTPEDPITLEEDILEEGPAIVVVRGMTRDFGNRVGGGDQAIGFVLVKHVRNMTTRPWHSFEIEVREIRSRTSSYEDGLSFGQAMGSARLFGSDRFDQMSQTDEPVDAVVFSGATVLPGETVTIRVVVTDFSPTWQFYILQRREAPLADERGPAVLR